MRRGGIGSEKRVYGVVICVIETVLTLPRNLDDTLTGGIWRNYTSVANIFLFPNPRKPQICPCPDTGRLPKSAIAA